MNPPKGRDEGRRMNPGEEEKMSPSASEGSLYFRSLKHSLVGFLVPGFCHELNNPIHNILLTLETLIEEDRILRPEERMEMVREALEEAERARVWVKDLQELTRDGPWEEVAFSVEDLVDQCLRWVRNESKARRFRMTKTVKGPLRDCRADKSGLRLVLLHLLWSGMHFFNDGGKASIALEMKGEDVLVELHWKAGGCSLQTNGPSSRRSEQPALMEGEVLKGLIGNMGGRIEVEEEASGERRVRLFFPCLRESPRGR
jgi:K+-sensing histidine kinase KdpD